MIVAIALLIGCSNPIEPAHTANSGFVDMMKDGWNVGQTKLELPAPLLSDEQTADEQTTALLKLAGSRAKLEELLRDSVTSPFLLKIRDIKTDDSVIRVVDLHFAIHADLSKVNLDDLVQVKSAPPVEVGNMRFEAKVLSKEELKARSFELVPQTHFVHSSNRMLDRIQVENTARIEVTKSPDSIVVSSRTDPKFDADPTYPNQWKTLARAGLSNQDGKPQVYSGAVGYTKASRLAASPKIVFVESHLAYAEPKSWFDGAPILRSKFSLIAQDQIRRLRRELAKPEKKN